MVLGPIFESSFEESAYGHHLGRSAQEVVQKIHRSLWKARRGALRAPEPCDTGADAG